MSHPTGTGGTLGAGVEPASAKKPLRKFRPGDKSVDELIGDASNPSPTPTASLFGAIDDHMAVDDTCPSEVDKQHEAVNLDSRSSRSVVPSNSARCGRNVASSPEA
jgi:hypothetical protein